MTIIHIDRGPRLTQAIVHGDTVYLAGQVCEAVTVAAQTRAVLAQIEDLLARAGSSKNHLLAAMVWLSDIADFDEMNSVWDAWIADVPAPTRATGQVKLPNPAHRIEIIITAAKA
jgi:enamine deaminase RidA (YjgF/YER057c/UK114 family)